jgi:hypothetical protein
MATGDYFVMYCPEYEINIFLWTVLINLYSNHFKCLPPNVKLGQNVSERYFHQRQYFYLTIIVPYILSSINCLCEYTT